MAERGLEIIEASWHRNGIGGVGFYAVLFKDHDELGGETMIASLFDEPGYCAVYAVKELSAGNVTFANGNSWRGDNYEAKLRPLVNQWLEGNGTNRAGPFAFPGVKPTNRAA